MRGIRWVFETHMEQNEILSGSEIPNNNPPFSTTAVSGEQVAGGLGSGSGQ